MKRRLQATSIWSRWKQYLGKKGQYKDGGTTNSDDRTRLELLIPRTQSTTVCSFLFLSLSFQLDCFRRKIPWKWSIVDWKSMMMELFDIQMKQLVKNIFRQSMMNMYICIYSSSSSSFSKYHSERNDNDGRVHFLLFVFQGVKICFLFYRLTEC